MNLEDLRSMQPGAIFPILYKELKAVEISLIFNQYKFFCKDNLEEATQNLRNFVVEYYRNRPASHELLGPYIEKMLSETNYQPNNLGSILKFHNRNL